MTTRDPRTGYATAIAGSIGDRGTTTTAPTPITQTARQKGR